MEIQKNNVLSWKQIRLKHKFLYFRYTLIFIYP